MTAGWGVTLLKKIAFHATLELELEKKKWVSELQE
jgi:hypothetical protein